jgi:murein DD-endopeptidase MepM/ murein hydrolase activator NlpD
VNKPKKKIYRRLKNKYRLVMMNDQTFEERISFRLSPLNVFVFAGLVIIGLITFTIFIIAFTPLKEYIPGYADIHMKRQLIQMTHQADSLSASLRSRDMYLENLKSIMSGDVGEDSITSVAHSTVRYDTISFNEISREDSLLRVQMESQDQFALTAGESKNKSGIAAFYFFTPLKGTVTNEFDAKSKHYGIDIVAAANEVIKSTMDGTVLFSDWTSETGYTIALQHSNNMFSLYKHNSALLKSVGDYVKAGEVIAIIGNTGEFTTGPHLHFELWYHGNPVNPKDYMTF